MSGIVWLASYPKSGNTWFRIFLSNLLGDAPSPADINKLTGTTIASARKAFDDAVGFEASDLTPDEIDLLRPDIYRLWAEEADETPYHKIHDAYTRLPDGRPLVPPEATAAVIYMIRNPLDVAASFASHCGCDIDRAIRNMGEMDFSFCREDEKITTQLRQRLLTWSGHALSWVDAPGLRLHVIRYEDMKHTPLETFSQAARFLGLPDDRDAIENALKNSDIRELQRQEKDKGFRERSAKAPAFFRKGKTGGWRTELTEEQAARIIRDHGDVMGRFGYLDENGQPVDWPLSGSTYTETSGEK